MKHSKQWLQLALDTQYYNLSKIRSTVFPLSEKEDQQLEPMARSLADKREHKIQSLLKQQCKNYHKSSHTQPEGFKNLSTTTMDANLITVLNKGPSFVNANPKILPKLCLTSRASLQLATDKLEQHNISGSVINEFKTCYSKTYRYL